MADRLVVLCVIYFRALHDREEIQHQFDDLVSTVNHIHHMVHGHDGDHSHSTKLDEHSKHLPSKDIIHRLNSTASGIQVLKNKNHEMNKYVQFAYL